MSGSRTGDAGASRVGIPAQGRELRARGRRTLRRLLDAGAAVFAERGLHAARVDDVVKAAKTSHGTFYLYFANKEDLFRALTLDVAERMVELAADFPEFSSDGDGRLALRAWLDQFADLYEQYGAVIRAWTEAEIVDSEFGRIGGDLVTRFAGSLEDRLRISAPDVDPQVAALAIVAMIERSSYYVLSHQLKVDREQMLDTLATVTSAIVFGDGVSGDGVSGQGPTSGVRPGELYS
jgi:AcrR family transcriptional regulator